MTENRLTVRENSEIIVTPADLVENATTQSRLLMEIVEQTKCYQTISGKKYLQVEAWETIGAFNRVHAVTESITPIVRDLEVVGYQANVELMRDGMIVGGASMPCFFTENACKGKEGDAKHKACMSAAQTFATSKAYRMNYSYVAILAGFQPTPAEEMTGESPDDRPANLEHWCEKHQTKWFKRGKMKGYAHPIGDTGEWCNEPMVTEADEPDIEQAEEDKNMWPEDTGNAKEAAVKPQPEATEPPKKASKPRRELKIRWDDVVIPDFKDINDMQKWFYQLTGVQPKDQLRELGYGSNSEVVDSPKICAQNLIAIFREIKGD
jgi:hypothetical protein